MPSITHPGGLLLLYDVVEGVVPEELGEGPVLLEQGLVGAHLGHAPVHQHHDVVHLRQETDAVRHQDTCLEGNEEQGGNTLFGLMHHAFALRRVWSFGTVPGKYRPFLDQTTEIQLGLCPSDP